MTIQEELAKILAAAEYAQDAYNNYANASEDTNVRDTFKSMADQMDQHISNIHRQLATTRKTEISKDELPPY